MEAFPLFFLFFLLSLSSRKITNAATDEERKIMNTRHFLPTLLRRENYRKPPLIPIVRRNITIN